MKGRLICAWLFLAAAGLSAAQNGTVLPPKKDSKDEKVWPDAAAIEAARLAAENRPLFASSEPLGFSLVADFGQVQHDRDPESDKNYPASIVLSQGTPEEKSIAVRIRTRGHSRLKPDFCTFAPLRIIFPENPTGTVFEGQKSLKLGVHCREAGDYPEYTLREYPVYRMFNVLTPNSFRARLAEVRYVDSKNSKTNVRGGLFIEDDDDVARRMGGRISDSTGPNGARLDFGMTSLTTMFEYLIGNTDVSIRSLHNIRAVVKPDGTRYPVPYDFDFSGLVDAPYSAPNPMLKISTVRERLYLGPCQTPAVLNVFLSRFRTAREALLAVYDSVPMLKPKYRTEAKEYLDEFYRKTEGPGGVKRAFIEGCGTRPYM
jgi:hypothetical protein